MWQVRRCSPCTADDHKQSEVVETLLGHINKILLKEHVKVVNLLGRENKKQVIPPVDVRLPSPPPVPQWTSELVWSHVKQSVKQQLLAARGQICRLGAPPPTATSITTS